MGGSWRSVGPQAELGGEGHAKRAGSMIDLKFVLYQRFDVSSRPAYMLSLRLRSLNTELVP